MQQVHGIALLLLLSSLTVDGAGSKVVLSSCQLWVDDKPFVAKGIGYSPALISENGLHADLYGSSRAAIHNRDLELIAATGANTIRLWGFYHLSSSYTSFFDLAGSYGLKVMPSFPLNPDVYPDIKSKFAVTQIKADFREFVLNHYQSDSLLFWLIGNEPNKDRVDGGYQNQMGSFITVFNELVEIRNEIEGEFPHPACAPLADKDFLDIMGEFTTGPVKYTGELWCVQPYRGPTFVNEGGHGDIFSTYPKNITGWPKKPLFFTEYGADSWNNVENREDREEQSRVLFSQFSIIKRHLFRSDTSSEDTCFQNNTQTFLAGVSLMEWVDEWWKGAVTDMSNSGVCPDPLASRHRPCGITAKGYKDHHLAEEYLGIMEQDNYLTTWCIVPKDAYFNLTALYGGDTVAMEQLHGRHCVFVISTAVAVALIFFFVLALAALACHVRAWHKTVNEGVDKRHAAFKGDKKERKKLTEEELGELRAKGEKEVVCVRTCPTRMETVVEGKDISITLCVYCGKFLHDFCIGMYKATNKEHYMCPNCAGVLKDTDEAYLMTIDMHSLVDLDETSLTRTNWILRKDEAIVKETIITTFKDTPYGWAENAKWALHMAQARDLVDKFILRERYTRSGKPRSDESDFEACSLDEAIDIVHGKLLEGYLKWTDGRKLATRLTKDAFPARKRTEAVAWMTLRSMSEMVFHCPARLAQLFHVCVSSNAENLCVDITTFLDTIYMDMTAVMDTKDPRNFDDINRYALEATKIEEVAPLPTDVAGLSAEAVSKREHASRGGKPPEELQGPAVFPRVDKYFHERSGASVIFVIMRNAMPLVSQKLWAFAVVGIAVGLLDITEGEGKYFFQVLVLGDGVAALFSAVVDVWIALPRCCRVRVRAKCPLQNIVFTVFDVIYFFLVVLSLMFAEVSAEVSPMHNVFWMFDVPIIAGGFRVFYVVSTTVFRMYHVRMIGKDSKANIFFRYAFWFLVLTSTALFENYFMLSSMLNLRAVYVCKCEILDGTCFRRQQTTLCAAALGVTWSLLFSTFLVTNQACFMLFVAIFGLFTGIRRKLGNVASGSAKFTYNNLRVQLSRFVGESAVPKADDADDPEKISRKYRVLMENIDMATEGFVGVVESLSERDMKGKSTSTIVSNLLHVAARGQLHPFHQRFQHGCKFREYVRPTTMHTLLSKIGTAAQKDLFTKIAGLMRSDILRRLGPGFRDLVYAHYDDGHAFASLRQAGKTAIKDGLDALKKTSSTAEADAVIFKMLSALFANIPNQYLPDIMDTMLRQMLHGNAQDLQMSKGTELLTIKRFVTTVRDKGLLRSPAEYSELLGLIRSHAENLCQVIKYFEALNIMSVENKLEKLLNQHSYIKLCCARIWEEILNDLWSADRISREERRLLEPRNNIVYQARLKTNDAMEWLAYFVSTLTGIHLSSRFVNKTHLQEQLLYRRSLTVLIPCYSEQIIYSVDYLRERRPNQMGLANIECLVYTYRHDWLCFSERMLLQGLTWLDSPAELLTAFLDDSYSDVGPSATAHELELEIRLWATYRGQTVARTIRGTMAYRRVLRMLCVLQGEPESRVDELYQVVLTHQQFSAAGFLKGRPETVPDVDELIRRFQIQVSYDLQLAAAPPERLKEVRNLVVNQYKLHRFDHFACFDSWKSLSCLRGPWSVAAWLSELGLYTEEREAEFKAHDLTTVADIRAAFRPPSPQDDALAKFLGKLNLTSEENYKLNLSARKLEWKSYLKYAVPRKYGVVEKCAGNVRTQGKAGNQRIGLTFIYGQVLQALDANQDGCLGEALKMNMLLGKVEDGNKIVGFREDIFTRHEGAVGRFMGYAEFCFGTIFQRVLHSPLGVRLHYGHPDLMDAYWLRSHGVMSKASPNFNLNEDIFAAYDAVLNQERVTHTEWVEYCKGRETNFLGAAGFEAKLAAGSVAQTRSRDVYDLNYKLDGIRQFNLFYGSLGFYMCTLLTVFSISLYVLSYVLLSLNLTTRSDLGGLKTNLSGEWLFHIGFLLLSPLLVELCLERGVKAGIKTVVLDVFLSTLFFVFHLQTKGYWMMKSLTTGKAAYVNTGRPLSMSRHTLVDAYKSFGMSHYHPAVVLGTLILVYFSASSGLPDGGLPFYTVCMTVFSWLMSPVIFNPFPSAGDCHQELAEMWDWLAHGYVAEYRLSASKEGDLTSKVGSKAMGNVSFKNFFVINQVERLADLCDGTGLLAVFWFNLCMIVCVVSFVMLCLPPSAFAILVTTFGLWSVIASAYMLVPMVVNRGSKNKESGSSKTVLISKAQRGPLKFFVKHLMWMVPLGLAIWYNYYSPAAVLGLTPDTILALLLNLAVMNYFEDAVFCLCFWFFFRKMKADDWRKMKMHDFFHHIGLLFFRRHIAFFIAIGVASAQTLLGWALSIINNLHTKIILSADVSQRLAQGASHSLLSQPVSKMSNKGVTLSVERRTKKPTASSIDPLTHTEPRETDRLLSKEGEEGGSGPVPRAPNFEELFAYNNQNEDGFQDCDAGAAPAPARSINTPALRNAPAPPQ